MNFHSLYLIVINTLLKFCYAYFETIKPLLHAKSCNILTNVFVHVRKIEGRFIIGTVFSSLVEHHSETLI